MRQSSRMSPERVGFALGSTGPSESQDQSKGLFRAGPEFDQHWFATPSDEAAEDEGDDDRIVELPSHWDEVRDKVERQSEIRNKGDQQQLAPPRHTRIACKARHEHDAVGYQRGKCPRVRASAPDHEPGEERAVYDEDHAERDQEPCPPLHAPTLPAWRNLATRLSCPEPHPSPPVALGGVGWLQVRSDLTQRRTVMLVRAFPDLPQSILTGHVPGFVLEPTLHVPLIFVPRFAPSPAAREAVVE
jgi:hypothetical protein